MSRPLNRKSRAPLAVETANDEDEQEGGSFSAVDVGSPLVFTTKEKEEEAVELVTTSTTSQDDVDVTIDDVLMDDGGNGTDGSEPPSSANDIAVDSGMTASHLVEGDFFPEAPPSVIEEIESRVEEEEAAAEAERPLKKKHTQSQDGTSADTATPSPQPQETAAPPAPTPPKATRRAARKRVSWANNLIKHVATFYMPDRNPAFATTTTASPSGLNDPGSPTFFSSTVAPAPPSIFSEKANADGTKYKCCKAQRPSQRFTDWKRQIQQQQQQQQPPQQATPFPTQPRDTEDEEQPSATAGDQPTLFANLYRRGGGAGVGGAPSAAGWRRPEPHARARPAATAPWATRCPQLPYIDPNNPYDEPLALPL